jgi:hypothetical protein
MATKNVENQTVKDLRPSSWNPRKITDHRLDMLKKSMQEYGDLSGIVVNVKTGNLVGGHQRLKHLDPSWPIDKHPVKDSTGTVALGSIKTPFGLWSYREVSWSKNREAAASIAANQQGGEFDQQKLREIILEIDDGSIDIELTGFNRHEIELMATAVHPEEKEAAPGKDGGNKIVECPNCGHKFSILKEVK